MARKLSEMTGAERVAWLQQQRQKKTAGIDTFENDLTGVYESLGGIDGWRDKDTMAGYGSSVSSMLKRANAYRDYYKSNDAAYDSTEIDKTIERLTGASEWLAERSEVFGGYESADDYNAAVKKYADAEAKYGGLSSAELKQVMEDYIAERDSKNEDIDAQIAEERAIYDRLYNLTGAMELDEDDIAFLAQYGLDPTEVGYNKKAAEAVKALYKDTEAKIAELEKGRLAEADTTAQHYYYQALMEELGAQGYTSEKKGSFGLGTDRNTNFDYAVRAGEDAINDLISAQKLATGAHTDFEATGYGTLTDEEKSLYLYLYDNVSPEAAVDYYNYLYNTNSFYNMALAARVGVSRSEAKSDFERVMGAFGAGLNSWIAGNERAIKSLYSDEAVPTYPFEYEMQFDRETLDDSVVKKGLYDLGVSFGNMAPSVLAGVLTSGMGTGVQLATNVATFGVSIYGNAYDEALKQGYSKSQAINYGILNAASEVALQNLIGGIPGVGQHLTGEFVTQLANKTSNVLLKVAAQIGGDALGEFTEEYLQEVLGQVFRNVALGENGEVKLFSEEALYSGIIGALMSMGMSVPVEAVNAVNLNSVGKLYNTEISETADGIGKTGAQALIEEGLAANPTSEAYQYAKRLSKRQKDGKTISNIQMGTLARLIERTDAVEPSGGNVQFQIRYTIDNAPVVEVTEDILEGVPRSEWVKTVKNKIAEFAPSIPLHGRLVKVNQKTKNEYTNSKYTQKKKRGADSVYEDKLKAAGKLDEIVLASTNYINEDLKHERADNIKEFARGDVNLRIGEDDYSAKVIVGFTKQNEMVLYDVIDFIPRTFRLKEKNRASDITVQDTSKGLAGSDRQENSVDSGNGQVLRVQAQSSPQLTSETLHDYPAANNSIPYSEEFVKNNLENHFSKYKGSIDELWSAALVMDSEADASETASSGERTAENSNAVTGKIEAPEAIVESDTEDDERLAGYRADVETVTKAAEGLSGNSEMVAQYEKVNADAGDRARQNADVYVSDYTMVRDLAAGGSSEATIRRIIESGNGAGASLNEAQFLAAFYEGRALHDRQKGKKPVVDRSRPRRVGKVYYNGAQAVRVGGSVLSLPASGVSRGKKLNADQQAVVDFAEKVLAPMGVNVVLYSSRKDRSLPNGLYDGKNIYIDIEAGMSERASETFVAYALAHELTHMAERLSPELWQKYADAVLDILAREEGISIRGLMERRKLEYTDARIGSLKKTYPEKKDVELREMVEPLSDDGAIREIVADASQLIFTRESRFAEKLAEKDATLWGKIKQLVMDAIKKLQEVLHGVPHDGISEHLVNHLEELREYFDDMMADALYQAGYGTAEENDFFAGAMENGKQKEKSRTDGTVQFQERAFSEQVDDIEKNRFPRGNLVYVGKTPSILQKVGLNGNLPMLTTATHIKKALEEKIQDDHTHGLTKDQIKALPEKIANPVMIMDSLNDGSNSIVIVTDMLDGDKNPVIIAVKADSKGMYHNIEMNSNFILTYYGKDGFHNFIDKNVRNNTFLFIDEKRSRILSNQAKVQFFGKLKSYDLDTIIRKTKANVKPFVEKNYSGENDAQAQERRADFGTNRELLEQWYEKGMESSTSETVDGEAFEEKKKKPTSYTKEEARALVDDIMGVFSGEGFEGRLDGVRTDAIERAHLLLNSAAAGERGGISEHLVNHLEELRGYFDDMMADSLYRAGHGTAEENDFFESALEKGQKKEKSQTTGKVQNQNRRIPEDVSDAERPGKSKKERIGMADFVNRDSAVWRNVAYENDAEKLKIMQDVHSAMVEEGAVVTVPYEVLKTVSQSFPDLRGVKKKERTPLLKEAIGKLKNDIKNFLDGLKNKSFEFEVSGKILEAKLYNTGINEVLEKITQSKAGMLYATEQIFRNARYLYSTSDYDGDSNVYRWNYFYTPVKIGEETVGVRIAVRDLAKQGESQIYNWGIKRDASLGGVGDDLNNRKSNGTSSDASTNMIHQDEPIVKENTENIFANRNSDDGQFQYRRIDADTDRQMLVRALEGAAKSEADRGIVKDYAERLGKYREMQRQLNDIRKDIDETLEDVNAGLVHKSELNPLYNRANILEEKLRSEDAKLLRMEALAPLHNLVEAERAKALAAEQEATRERAKSEKRLEAQKQAMENRQAANKRKAQERQLRIQYLARAERAISRLYRWTAHPTKKDHVPTDLLPYVKSLFEAVDVSHHFAQIEKLEEQLAAQNSRIWELQEAGAAASVIEAQEAFRDDLINRIKKLEGTQHNVTWADRLGQLGKIMSSVEKAQETSSIYVSFAPGLAEAIEKQVDTFTDDVHVRLFDASPEKIRFYAEAIESIAHSITEAGRLYANKRAAKVETLAELTIDEFRHERQEAAKPHVGAWARGFYGIDALSPAYFAHKLGHGAEAVMGGLFDGFYNTIGNVRVINEFSDRLREKYKVSSFTGKNNVIHHIKLEQGGAISLTTTQLMTVYALSDRPQAQKHMFGRGIQSFQGNIDEAVRKTQPLLDSMKDEAKRWVGKGDSDLSQYAEMLFGSIDIHKLTQKDVDGMIDLLTGDQKACVKEIKTFLHDVVAPMGNKTSQTLYLYDMFTEDNYFPIETVKTYLRPKDKDMKDGDIDTRSIFSILNQGFTKNLSDQAGNPIVIRDIFDVFMEHCFGMANYGGLGVAVSDTIKWLSYRQAGEGSTLRDEMKKAWGTSAERYIRNLLMSIEGELKGTDGARAINKLVRNAKIASVAGNARVVLQQPTAYFRAGAVLSPKSMLNASIHPFDLKKMIEEATEHSELMYYKSLGFYDMNNSQSLLEKMKGDKSMADRIREWTTAPAGAMDMMTWGTLWRACRLEIDSEIREKGLSVTKNSDEYFRMVRDKFHEVINLTQVIDSPMHKNKLMSDPDSLMKQLTAFMAEPMLTLNMVQSAVDDVHRKRPGGKVKLVRASVVFLLSTAATGVMSAFADAARDDDDDEGWMEKYLEAALRNITGVDLDDISVSGILAGDWNLLNNMPIIKEFFSILEGYDPSRMELSGMEKMVQAMNKVYKFFSGEGTGDFESVMYSIAQVISAVSGIPVSNLWRLVRSMVNTVKAWAQ